MVVVALGVAVAALLVALLALLTARSAVSRADAALAPARRASADDVDWQLQWIEPGVYVLANTSPATAAEEVEVTSSLTPASGGPATSATVRMPRVNPGAWLEVRHPGVGREVFDDLQQLRRSTALSEEIRRRALPLEASDRALLAATGESIDLLSERVEFTLVYEVTWRSTGEVRHKMPLKQRLVPSPAG